MLLPWRKQEYKLLLFRLLYRYISWINISCPVCYSRHSPVWFRYRQKIQRREWVHPGPRVGQSAQAWTQAFRPCRNDRRGDPSGYSRQGRRQLQKGRRSMHAYWPYVPTKSFSIWVLRNPSINCTETSIGGFWGTKAVRWSVGLCKSMFNSKCEQNEVLPILFFV